MNANGGRIGRVAPPDLPSHAPSQRLTLISTITEGTDPG
jgi:hypothetical protein